MRLFRLIAVLCLYGIMAAPVALLLLLVFAPAAYAGLFDTTVNLKPVTDYVIQVLAAVLIAVLIWAGNSFRAWLDKRFDLSKTQIDELLQQQYNEAVLRSIAYAESAVKGAVPKEADVNNVFVRAAADYMIKMFPKLVKDMPPDKVAETVISRLPSPTAEKAEALAIAKAGGAAEAPKPA